MDHLQLLLAGKLVLLGLAFTLLQVQWPGPLADWSGASSGHAGHTRLSCSSQEACLASSCTSCDVSPALDTSQCTEGGRSMSHTPGFALKYSYPQPNNFNSPGHASYAGCHTSRWALSTQPVASKCREPSWRQRFEPPAGGHRRCCGSGGVRRGNSTRIQGSEIPPCVL